MPPKTNMESENHLLEKKNHLTNLHFAFHVMLVFRGVSLENHIRHHHKPNNYLTVDEGVCLLIFWGSSNFIISQSISKFSPCNAARMDFDTFGRILKLSPR